MLDPAVTIAQLIVTIERKLLLRISPSPPLLGPAWARETPTLRAFSFASITPTERAELCWIGHSLAIDLG